MTADENSNSQSAPEPWKQGISLADQNKALTLYVAGNRLFDQRRFSEALAKYRQALQIWDHPKIRYNAAKCLRQLGELVEAEEFYRSSLRWKGRALGDDERRVDAERALDALSMELATVAVKVVQKGVAITLDGEDLATGSGTYRRRLPPGPHRLVASGDGLIPRTMTVELAAGRERFVEVELETVESAPLVRKRRWPQWVPWAVLAGGVMVVGGMIPLEARSRTNFDDFDRNLRMECPNGCFIEDLSQATQDLRSTARLQRALAISGFAVGGVAIAAGAAMVILNRPQLVPEVSASSNGVTVGARMSF